MFHFGALLRENLYEFLSNNAPLLGKLSLTNTVKKRKNTDLLFENLPSEGAHCGTKKLKIDL
jgi:hypothetical protein